MLYLKCSLTSQSIIGTVTSYKLDPIVLLMWYRFSLPIWNVATHRFLIIFSKYFTGTPKPFGFAKGESGSRKLRERVEECIKHSFRMTLTAKHKIHRKISVYRAIKKTWQYSIKDCKYRTEFHSPSIAGRPLSSWKGAIENSPDCCSYCKMFFLNGYI